MTIAEIITAIIQSLLVLGLWAYVFYIGKTVKDVKTMTDSMKNVFDSLNISQEFFKKVHETAKSLYDPEEVEKLVQIKVEKGKHESQKQQEKAISKMQQEHTETRQGLIDMFEKRTEIHWQDYKKIYRMFIDYYILSLPYIDQTRLNEYLDKYSEEETTKALVSLHERYLPKQLELNAFIKILASSVQETKES